MRSDVVFETKCPASILNEHMGCLSACRLSLTVSRTRQIREDARSRAAGLCVPCGRASKQSPGIKAVLGAPAGSGHIRTASMPYSTKLPLLGWLWTEMPFAHWKHRPNSSTEVSPLSPPSFYFIPCHHGQPTPCVIWGCGDVPLSRAELTREGIFPWQSCSGSRIRSETNMSLSIS